MHRAKRPPFFKGGNFFIQRLLTQKWDRSQIVGGCLIRLKSWGLLEFRLKNRKVGYITALLGDYSLKVRVFTDQVGVFIVKVPVFTLHVPDSTHQVDDFHHQVANFHD